MRRMLLGPFAGRWSRWLVSGDLVFANFWWFWTIFGLTSLGLVFFLIIMVLEQILADWVLPWFSQKKTVGRACLVLPWASTTFQEGSFEKLGCFL